MALLRCLAIFWLSILCAPAGAQDSPRPADTPLILGQSFQKEIKVNETQGYSFKLEKDYFAQVVVESKGVDVVLTLFGLDGKPIARSRDYAGDVGVERVTLIVDEPQLMRLEVSAIKKLSGDGSYAIQLKTLRLAQKNDRDLVAAENILSEGRRTTGIVPEARRRAIEKYKEAFDLFLKAGDKRSACNVLHDMGQAYYLLGERQKELAVYEQALALRREINDRKGEAATLRQICDAHNLLNEKQKALTVCAQALQIQREVEPRSNEAALLYQLLGTLYSSLGSEEAAFDYYQQGYAISREIGARPTEVRILNQIGELHFDLQRYKEALNYYQKALQAQQEYFGGLRIRRTILLLGRVYFKLGQTETALHYLNQALVQERRLGGPILLSNILISLSQVYLQKGERQKALEHLREALSIKQFLHSRLGEAEARYWIAQVERDGNNLAAAITEIEKTIEISESVRAELAEQELRVSYFIKVERYYEFYLDLLWQLHQQQPNAGYDVKAFNTSERVRARGLVELLSEIQTDIRQGVPPELLERERALQQRLNARAEVQVDLLNRKHTPEQAEAIDKELQEILSAYSDVQAQIRLTCPRYAALVQPQALTLPEIQASLDPNTLLLEYRLGANRSFLWAITGTSFAAYELPKRAEIETRVRSVYQLLTTRNKLPEDETDAQRQTRLAQAESEYKVASAKLGQALFAPIASQLKNQRLVIVSDGALQYIPFGALPIQNSKLRIQDAKGQTANHERRTMNNAQLLIVNHEIVSLPSASVIAVLRREFANRPSPKKTVAIFADPVFAKEDVRLKGRKTYLAPAAPERLRDLTASNKMIRPRSGDETTENEQNPISRLPFSRREAQEIQKVAPPEETFVALDFNANHAKATSPELAQYRIIHFATHGWLDSRHPELSSLILSLVNERGEPQDGYLRLHEVYNLELNADLVVLSACQTGLGKEVRGEGLVGLTRGFMYAGAARVTASLWKVDDLATAELMGQFYRFRSRAHV